MNEDTYRTMQLLKQKSCDVTDLSRVGSPLDSGSVIVKDHVAGLDFPRRYSMDEFEKSCASSGLD